MRSLCVRLLVLVAVGLTFAGVYMFIRVTSFAGYKARRRLTAALPVVPCLAGRRFGPLPGARRDGAHRLRPDRGAPRRAVLGGALLAWEPGSGSHASAACGTHLSRSWWR